MDGTMFWSYILDHIFVPVMIVIGAALVIVVKHYADKIAKSIVAKNEISSMTKENTTRKELIETLNSIVESAVASNMQLAEAMKKNGQKLTQEQIEELNNTCKTLVINSLPLSLTEENGVLLEVIGGKEKLNAIISSMMEKHVYEYKVKNTLSQNNLQTTSNEGVVDKPQRKFIKTRLE